MGPASNHIHLLQCMIRETSSKRQRRVQVMQHHVVSSNGHRRIFSQQTNEGMLQGMGQGFLLGLKQHSQCLIHVAGKRHHYELQRLPLVEFQNRVLTDQVWEYLSFQYEWQMNKYVPNGYSQNIQSS